MRRRFVLLLVSLKKNVYLKKFQNILKMNLEEANNLLSQIQAYNKVFFEEHLAIRILKLLLTRIYNHGKGTKNINWETERR